MSKRNKVSIIVIAAAAVVLAVCLVVMMLNKPVAGTPAKVDKTEVGLAFIEDAGFKDPKYIGATQGAEGKYPTYEAQAIYGGTIKLWFRSDLKPWSLQPIGVFTTIETAGELVRIADKAVREWEHKSPTVKPSTDGSFGEYEGLQYDYEQLERYATPTP